ncbi:MAG: type II toxin-antitoxin system VapC family toxin [Nocardioides sp.]
MIVYVDTSALVPLLIEESTTEACGELWDGADRVVVTRLAYVEAAAALAMAARIGRILKEEAEQGRSILDDLWPAVDVIELDHALMIEAARLAGTYGLRGYDATHCAAARAASDSGFVAASGDTRLLTAWQAEGVNVFDTGRP